MGRAAPSPQRDRVRVFLESEQIAGRPFPSKALIQEHMGWKNVSSVHDCLAMMMWRDRYLLGGVKMGRLHSKKFRLHQG